MTSLSIVPSDQGSVPQSIILRAGRFVSDRISAAVGACRRLLAKISLPVVTSRRSHDRALECLVRLESQSLALAGQLSTPEKRLRAFIDVARTAHDFTRSTGAALQAALGVLKDHEYFAQKQGRVFTATKSACTMAKLAAASGQTELAHEAYHCAQQYNALVADTDRKIGLAIVLSDVAAKIQAVCDQAAWLTVGMELASGIEEGRSRLEAVSFVARQMVAVGIPPAENAEADSRFLIAEEPAEAADEAKPAETEDVQFNVTG